MISRHRLFFAALATLIATTCVDGAEPQQPPPPPLPESVPAKPVAQLVAELDDSRYALREAATRALMIAGKSAVGPLAKAAESDSLEVAVRAIAILQKIYKTDDDETIDAAEIALEDLATSKNRSTASRANSVLQASVAVRQKRAVVRIQKLGGIFRDLKDAVYDPNAAASVSSSIPVLQLGSSWKGGDQGLRYVKRLTGLRRILFIERTSEVSEQALTALTVALGGMEIVRRGPALLGVRASVLGRPCEISEVRVGSAAYKANMKPGDIVSSFDGKPVSDFNALVDLIRKNNPGDKIPIKVLRQGKPVELQVTLDSWEARAGGRSPSKPGKKPNAPKR